MRANGPSWAGTRPNPLSDEPDPPPHHRLPTIYPTPPPHYYTTRITIQVSPHQSPRSLSTPHRLRPTVPTIRSIKCNPSSTPCSPTSTHSSIRHRLHRQFHHTVRCSSSGSPYIRTFQQNHSCSRQRSPKITI